MTSCRPLSWITETFPERTEVCMIVKLHSPCCLDPTSVGGVESMSGVAACKGAGHHSGQEREVGQSWDRASMYQKEQQDLEQGWCLESVARLRGTWQSGWVLWSCPCISRRGVGVPGS